MPTSNTTNNSDMHYQYLNATGKLKYNMTNDYMFRMVLQRDRNTLMNLISSVLDLPLSEIKDVKIENVIEPGKAISDKEYQLDILVLLNNNTYINIEMQVVNYDNWINRSLAYLCRRFDNAARGKDYNDIKPVYHVGFLDFTLFEKHPEFFAKYQVRNARDGYLYTNNFNLYVIELNHTNMATHNDKRLGIDIWAKLFKATTWEEIKMITQDNPSMNSTAESIYLSNSDFAIQEQCRAREDAIAHEKYQQQLLEEQTKKLEGQAKQIADLSAEISRLTKLLEDNAIKH
ncbi:Rpn family recombination-promoting nuclease/putative transposase [Butyrivibrio sp. AC2005]|uniref:Rpn family recombination-promoting nuclease/putative transposase n=1 Tax=Butyrivibrio sp. AC2005 TaxID=1280672 RepID=UPI00047D3206|nr:Rpn family recombination-promoting nuclease/putative transposase [Butyrivibrio sp. AC2005]